MFKSFVTASAIGGLMMSTALAQTPAQPQPAQPPAATQPAPQATAPAATGPQFISAQTQDQFLGTRFRGTDVIGPNNEQVGDVNDVLFDSKGTVVGIVVGVGGFLGIGQKDVAIDLAAFEIVPADIDRNATTGTAAPAPAATPRAGGMGEGMRGAVTTDPNNVKLRVSWTKEQLEQAPSFERFRAQPATTGGAARPMGGATR